MNQNAKGEIIFQTPQFEALPENKPHPHAALIHAWAEGAIIQFWSALHGGEWGEWSDVKGNNPLWDPAVEYRIKPEPSPDIVIDTGMYLSSGKGYAVNWGRERAANLRLTFHPTTGELLSAEVLKKE